MISADSHVHIHDCYDLEAFLDSASKNLRAGVIRNSSGNALWKILLLTEAGDANVFLRLFQLAHGNGKIGKWTFSLTEENHSLHARRDNGDGIFLIAGRQIVASENLEVLALATEKHFMDGMPVWNLVETVKKSGAIPVIPWGFGKWMGRRGAVLEDLMQSRGSASFFLGDNGGRPHFMPDPYHFKLGKRIGFRNLPGSDPLPFVSENCRAGSYGFMLPGKLSKTHPARELKRMLMDSTAGFQSYGRLENPFRFIRNQVRMQITKRMKK